jgi:hypothetical protein
MKTSTLIALSAALTLGAVVSTACDVEDQSVTERGEHGPKGCTLTQGYWKNHNAYANGKREVPWPTNPTYWGWDEDSPVMYTLSAGGNDGCPEIGTYLEVLQSPTHGDAFYILAHQYIAARLNVANGAVDSDIYGLLGQAQAMLGDCQITEDERAGAIALSEELDAWNNGEWGPGHCDGDADKKDD